MRGCALILWARQGWKQKSLLPIRKDLITVFAASHLSLYLPSFSSRRSNMVSQQVFFHPFLDSQSGLRVAARVSLTQCESAFVSCLFTFSHDIPLGWGTLWSWAALSDFISCLPASQPLCSTAPSPAPCQPSRTVLVASCTRLLVTHPSGVPQAHGALPAPMCLADFLSSCRFLFSLLVTTSESHSNHPISNSASHPNSETNWKELNHSDCESLSGTGLVLLGSDCDFCVPEWIFRNFGHGGQMVAWMHTLTPTPTLHSLEREGAGCLEREA